MTAKAARVTASRLVREMVADARRRKAELLDRRSGREFIAARQSLAADLVRDVPPHEAADILAQAVVCAAPVLSRCNSAAVLGWLRESVSHWQQWVLEHAHASIDETEYSARSTEFSVDPAHLYEPVLHRHSPDARKRHGVFFTPQPIAKYIVGQVDQLLCGEFGLAEGLATQSAGRKPRSEIVLLDPACGTGVFLLAAIDHLHRRLGERWNEFVPNLLPRLTGIELMPVPALLAKLNLAAKLAETGYDFRQPATLQIHIGDALRPNLKSEFRNLKSVLPVILGNPPFSSLTTNTNPWIARLVRGDETVRGYIRAGDLRLGERKTWLHDDYVKFLRLAQWCVEEAGRGVVGMVTSRGFLDNATFRVMRHELLRVFRHIRLLDLHGSRKGGDVASDGGRDENVFGLDQGVAIAILARSASEGAKCASEGARHGTSEAGRHIAYISLSGRREDKLEALGTIPSLALRASVIVPRPPHWRFVPDCEAVHPEYTLAWSLADAMPVSTPAPVTARDHFVVAFTREQLHERIAEFCDLAIPDDEIRRRYFARTRSIRYPQGDTRSWKLAAARRAVASDEQWPARIVRCLYRPFDWRFVFWHPAMIDWPRNDVTRHLFVAGDLSSRFKVRGSRSDGTLNFEPGTLNLCLLARRQQLSSQPCTFFWVSDGLALDGVIRSDNRGSESLFPLWFVEGEQPRRANFAPEFVEQTAACIGREPSPEDLLAYIYALFHSPGYRERYAAPLRIDFPRVLLPRTAALFAQLASLGRRLIDLHLLREGIGSLWPDRTNHHGEPLPAKDSGPPVQDFRVGGYAVLAKWLQPKHRTARDPEFQSIALAVAQTQQLMAAIDAAIAGQGGFPAAFASRDRKTSANPGKP